MGILRRQTKNDNNAVVLQSGECAAIANASLVGVAEAWQELNDGVLFGSLFGIEGLIKNKLISLYPRDDFQKTTAINYAPSAALGSSVHKLKDESGAPKEEALFRIFGVLAARKIGYLFLIGGEDSRENAHTISQHAKNLESDLAVLHIPKSIENDLTFNHHSPGYLSAAQFIINSVARLDLANRAMPGVMINVVMGKSAGWLAAAARVSRECVASVAAANGYLLDKTLAEQSAGPHLIYLPEINFSTERFVADVSRVMEKFGRAHVVVAEGIVEHNAIKDYVVKIHGANFVKELCGNGILGALLCHIVKKQTHIQQICSNTFGCLQRVSEQSASDRVEAYKAGHYAVRVARDGLSHAMITLGSADKIQYSSKIGHADLSLAYEKSKPRIKTFPCKLIINGNNIADEFLGYIGAGEDDTRTIENPIFRVFDFNQVT